MIITDGYHLPADLIAANPLGKIPALVLDDGTALYEHEDPTVTGAGDRLQDGERYVEGGAEGMGRA